MSRFVYFLKAEAPSSPERGGRWLYAWAERVESLCGALWASNLQVVQAEVREAVLGLASSRLKDRAFHGVAYRVPEPKWFHRTLSEGESDPSGPSAHEVSRLMATSPLGSFCRCPAIERAFAQDRLAEAIAPYLALPDLLVHEDRLTSEWREARPEAVVLAERALASDHAFIGNGSGEFRAWRRRLRLAALRRLDAAAVGREVFEPCPSLFGEAYLADPKAGIVSQARYWPKLELEAKSRRDLLDPDLLRRTEMALSPLVALPLSEQEIAYAAWLELAALREFEAKSPLPLFPSRTVLPRGVSLPGYQRRFTEAELLAWGATDLTCIAAGLSPFESEPFSRYCSDHESVLLRIRRSGAELAQLKWSSAAPLGTRCALK